MNPNSLYEYNEVDIFRLCTALSILLIYLIFFIYILYVLTKIVIKQVIFTFFIYQGSQEFIVKTHRASFVLSREILLYIFE